MNSNMQEEKQGEARALLVEALLLLSEEAKQVAMALKDGRLSLSDCEEAIMQAIEPLGQIF